MIEPQTESSGQMASSPARLRPVRCALCGHIIAQMALVKGGLAGGLCLREGCRQNERNGKPKEVFTFNRVVDSL